MKFKDALIYIFIQFVILNTIAICSDVPVILWNVKGDSLQLKPISAFGNGKAVFDESMKDVLQKTSSGLLVFSVNKLSLEDFSAKEKQSASNNTLQFVETFLDHHPHMLIPYVTNPLDHIHDEAQCGVEEIIVYQDIDENVLQSITTAMGRSCVVILHVSDTSIVTKSMKADFEHIKHIFLPPFEKIKKSVVGMFSGMKSSWEIAANEHHSFRNLLAKPEESHFSNFSGCIIAYSESASVKVGAGEGNGTELQYPPSLEGSDCTSNNSAPILAMTFKASGNITSASLKLAFTKKGTSWVTSSMTLTLKGSGVPSGEIQLKGAEKIDAPVGFSYSCGKYVLKAKNASEQVTVTLTGFQVQPFEVGEKFKESFDCSTFFTIPIWSGLLVAFLFITILHAGIYALFSINTMDRFDDPKGKTISVTQATD